MDEIDREFIAFYQNVGKAYGMDSLMATIFARVYVEPGEMGMSELAEETGYSLASVSNKIRQLEPSGLITRNTKPGTRKVYVHSDKDILRIALGQLVRTRASETQPAAIEIPRMIERFEKEELSEKQQEKLEILRRYHRDMLKLDSLLEEMLEKLEKLSRQA
ncbi:MarR family transcriptional regulator [Methanosarcina sp. KYL-1]|uniref:GbsR/MarR family transcriptional regulator n=1 Tax=Methanosarcina sp. KYL-1 TaxID=2602068 RepID=UPI002100E3FC|nr:MarR family transcriptional regulator [Methanosarcina sp. KYL-1]MCQ1534204.1 MarR family transcriptional regulator [Methanosarcina sp. KYL-1]